MTTRPSAVPEPTTGVVSAARVRARVLLAYAAFVLVGVSAGVGGVAIPAQMADYGVDRTTIGITFFTFSAGFLAAGFSSGPIVHRFGMRVTLALGAGLFLVVALLTAARPSFALLVLLGLPGGYATGLLESGLNTQLTDLPGAHTLLNRLHAFFGVGALIGPLLASRLLQSFPWTTIWLVLAAITLPLLVGFLVLHPGPGGDGRTVPPLPASVVDGAVVDGSTVAVVDGSTVAVVGGGPVEDAPPVGERRRGLLATTVREPAVLLGAVLLTAYVGVELSIGTWAYGFLVEGRGESALLAGNLLSGYWLGLTVGRFVIMPTAVRRGYGTAATIVVCLLGVVVTSAVLWAVPGAAVSAVALGLTGFFLGPIFPTIMAATPGLTAAERVPTAIGVLNGVSVIGGSLLPWLAGVLAQHVALWTLWPYAMVLTAVQLLIWRALTPRLRTPPAP